MVIVSHIIVFLPVSIYASIVAYIAFLQNKFIVSAIIILSIFLITLISSLHVKNLLRRTLPQCQDLFGLKTSLGGLLSSLFFLSEYIYFYEKKMSAFALKIFSFLLFYLVFIRLADNFDKDSFINILILMSYFHSILLFHINNFLEEKCSFIRNMPFQ